MGKTTIDVGVRAVADAKSIADVDKKFSALRRSLGDLKIDFGKVAKQAISSTSEIHHISEAAKIFAKQLGEASVSSLRELENLGEKLDMAKARSAQLEKEYRKAGGPDAKKDIRKRQGEQISEIEKLTKQISAERSARIKEIRQIEQLAKAQERYQKKVDSASKFDAGDMWEGVKEKISRGDFKGIFGDIAKGSAKSLAGKYARSKMESAAAKGGMGTEAGAAEIAGAAKNLSYASMALGATVGVFVGFVALVKKASEHMTTLNKALLQGMGYANDFVSDAKGYRGVMNEMRAAAIASHGSMLKFGKSSEDVLKVINSYAKESTGSLLQTGEAMSMLGGGDLRIGMEQFATSAILYGKALNMEADEVASMMGRFQSEIGYGFGQVQDLMEGVVESARTSSMPMTKFMDIFKSVIPSVELYQNRLEELTGTIKLLSKTMSAADVKRFMDAFSKGFSGTDFKQRLKTVLITGTDKVSGILEKGFASKAESMAANFEKYGISKKDFMVAFKGGEKGMADMVAKIQAQSGGAMSGAQIGEMMKLASYEAARQKGGPLNMATAMRGASALDTYRILKAQSQTFTKGFDGLAEHVIQQTGISEQQYLALRQTHQSMEVWGEQMKAVGMTSSKSMNEAIKTRLGSQKWSELSQDAQENILFEASQQHNDEEKSAKTMEDLTQEQVSATTSIADKVENVIAFLLEKLYDSMQGVLNILDDVWAWMVGSKDQQNAIKEIKSWRGDFTRGMEAEAATAKTPKERDEIRAKIAQYDDFTKQVMKLTTQGVGQTDMAKSMGMDKNWMQQNADAIGKALGDNFKQGTHMTAEMVPVPGGAGLVEKRSEVTGETLLTKLKSGTATEAEIDKIQTMLGERHAMMALGRELPTSAAAQLKGASRRPGIDYVEGPKSAKEAENRRLAEKARGYDGAFGKEMVAKGLAKELPAIVGPAATGPAATGPAAAPGPESGGLAGPAALAAAAGPAPAKAEKATASMLDILGKISLTADSINTQVMGVSVHTDNIDKHLNRVQLDKAQFLAEIVGNPNGFDKMFSDILEEKLTNFLFALLLGWDDKNTDQIKKSEVLRQKTNMSMLADVPDWSTIDTNNLPEMLGHRDFGGDVPVTGAYRLQQGETVLRRGEGGARNVTINATINVNGAPDPRETAAAVRTEIYNLSNRS